MFHSPETWHVTYLLYMKELVCWCSTLLKPDMSLTYCTWWSRYTDVPLSWNLTCYLLIVHEGAGMLVFHSPEAWHVTYLLYMKELVYWCSTLLKPDMLLTYCTWRSWYTDVPLSWSLACYLLIVHEGAGMLMFHSPEAWHVTYLIYMKELVCWCSTLLKPDMLASCPD